MIDKIKNLLAFTETGAKGVVKASISSFFVFISFMLPVLTIMFFIENLLKTGIKELWFYSLIILVVAIFMYFILFINYNFLYTETYKESTNLRIDIANILKSLPLSYFSKNDVSDLSQVIMSDVERIEHAVSHAMSHTAGFILYFILISFFMLFNNFWLGLCVLIPIILAFIIIVFTKKIQINSSTKYFKQLRDNSESFQETIELNQEIKSFGLDKKIKDKLDKQMEESEKIHIKTEFSQALALQIPGVILKFSLGTTIFFGTILYINGKASLLYLLGYLIAATKIIEGVENIFLNLAEIFYIDSRIKRIKDLRNTKIQEGKDCTIKNFDIVFENVDFSYNNDRKVLDDISFTAKQNEVTALVGPSGCGKTTILRLISRLYDYDNGKISLDGIDIKNISTDTLFDYISIVFQDISLFNTSIFENIKIGKLTATHEEVINASKLAGCHEFISALPNGYETLIGENGTKLSGGERQRISIARAILKNAPIILLDEISASLDVENEKRIQESLNTLIKDKTIIIISHRMKSIENVDKIIVLNNGKIDAQGTHTELMKSSELYKSMIQKSNLTASYLY